jgi:GT2 family glycosyltransferase
MIVGIPVHNAFDTLFNAIDVCVAAAKAPEHLEFVLYDNGSLTSLEQAMDERYSNAVFSYHVVRSETNVGVPVACNYMIDYAKNKSELFAAIMHSDTVIYQQDWDIYLQGAFAATNAGVIGFYGADGIGTHDIYKNPYRLTQMIRIHTNAGSRCRLSPQVHGHLIFEEDLKACTVLDGFFLATNVNLRFDEASPHHMYDNDICLESISAGYMNFILNMDCDHPGGATDSGTDWNTIFNRTKQQIHSDAHVHFYNKWAPGNRNITLPYFI